MRRLAVFPLFVVLMAPSCLPSTPDQSAWRAAAIRSVEDVASSVATVEWGIEHDDDLFGRYLRSLVVHAEESADSSQQKLSSLQPPGAAEAIYDSATGTLSDATSVVADARIAVVEGDDAAYPGLAHRLDQIGDRLDALEQQLRAMPTGDHD